MTVGSDSICPKKCKYDIRIFCHFLVAKSDQKASLAKAKTHCKSKNCNQRIWTRFLGANLRRYCVKMLVNTAY